MRSIHGACDRARQWATADLDGELSRFEHVLLSAHLADCAPCREFAASIGGFTDLLRTAPPERLERPIEVGRLRRRRIGLRLAPAVAAMAVTVVGLGSILASSDLRTRPVGDTGGLDSVSSHLASVDTMNLSTAGALASAVSSAPVRITGAGHSSLHGGPVIGKR